MTQSGQDHTIRVNRGIPAVPSGDVFVGRQAPMATLLACADGARGSECWRVVVEGDTGFGKTALCEHFARAAGDFTTYWVSADPALSEVPLGTVVQLAVQLGLDPAQFSGASRATLITGGTLLAEAVRRRETRKPVLLVVDDVQWVDEPSAITLGLAQRSLDTEPVLVVFALSTGGPPLAPWVQRLLKPGPRMRRVTLAGLAEDEVDTLARQLGLGPLSASTTSAILARTSGQPLYLRTLLTAVPKSELAAQAGSAPLPSNLAEVVSQAMHDLPAASRLLLGALAVLDKRTPLPPLAEVAGIGDTDEAVRPAVKAGLASMRIDGPITTVELRHGLVRAAVYEQLSPADRRTLHKRAAEFATSGTESLKHRVAACGSPDPALAEELDTAASAAADRHEYAVAAKYLLWAIDVDVDAAAAERRLLQAVELLLTGQYTTSAESLRERVLACSDSPHRQLVLGGLAAQHGDPQQARTLLGSLVASTDTGAESIRSRAAVLLARLNTHFIDKGGETIDAARIALGLEPPDSPMAQDARAMIAYGRFLVEGPAAGLAELSDLASVPLHRMVPGSLMVRGLIKFSAGDLDGAAGDFRELVSRADAAVTDATYGYAYLSRVALVWGDWEESIRASELAVALADETGHTYMYSPAYAAAACVPAYTGNEDLARTYLSNADRWARESGTLACRAWVAAAYAMLWRSKSRYDESLRALDLFVGQDPPWTPAPGEPSPWWWRPLWIEALLETGRLDDAERALHGLLAADRPMPGIWELHQARLFGRLAELRDRRDEALAHYERGLAWTDTRDAPLERALLEQNCGRLLNAVGRRREGLELLRSAIQRFSMVGAVPFARHCEADLRAAGVIAQQRGESPLSLTEREKQIAQLVGKGLTSREISRELFISTHTVDYHLRNIFAKLGLANRRQLREHVQRQLVG